MSTATTNLVLRNDTILGVCQGLGEDFGFHPNWLRLALAGSFYWFPLQVIGTYLILGAILFVARKVAPDPVATAPAAQPIVAATNEPESADDYAMAA